MSDVAASEITLLIIIVLALFGAIVVLARFGARELSNASRSLGRSMRTPEAETKSLHDDDDKEPVEDASMRASSADRDRTIETLREETAQGRLTFKEFEERMESAQSAKTLGELSQLTQDLPNDI